MWTAPFSQDVGVRCFDRIACVHMFGLLIRPGKWPLPRWVPRRALQTVWRSCEDRWVARNVARLGSIDRSICSCLARSFPGMKAILRIPRKAQPGIDRTASPCFGAAAAVNDDAQHRRRRRARSLTAAAAPNCTRLRSMPSSKGMVGAGYLGGLTSGQSHDARVVALPADHQFPADASRLVGER